MHSTRSVLFRHSPSLISSLLRTLRIVWLPDLAKMFVLDFKQVNIDFNIADNIRYCLEVDTCATPEITCNYFSVQTKKLFSVLELTNS